MQTLYFAEYDLSFFKTRGEMMRHLRKCKLQHPPGDEIYRCHYPGGRSVSMFEVSPHTLLSLPCFGVAHSLHGSNSLTASGTPTKWLGAADTSLYDMPVCGLAQL